MGSLIPDQEKRYAIVEQSVTLVQGSQLMTLNEAVVRWKETAWRPIKLVKTSYPYPAEECTVERYCLYAIAAILGTKN